MLPIINQTLYLHVNSIDEEEAKEEYKSRISDMDDTYINMEIPINERTGRLKRLYVGDELDVHFITEGGVKNYFSTTVLGFKEDVIRMVIIKKPDPESITKVQRRSFLRVPAELEIAVCMNGYERFLALTEDVSGGGISFICDKHVKVEAKQSGECWLLLPQKTGKPDHSFFKCEVLRVVMKEQGKQLVMLRFTDISERDRQRIIRFCFERQLEFRKQ